MDQRVRRYTGLVGDVVEVGRMDVAGIDRLKGLVRCHDVTARARLQGKSAALLRIAGRFGLRVCCKPGVSYRSGDQHQNRKPLRAHLSSPEIVYDAGNYFTKQQSYKPDLLSIEQNHIEAGGRSSPKEQVT